MCRFQTTIGMIIGLIIVLSIYANAVTSKNPFDLATILVELDGTASAIDTLTPALVKQQEEVIRSLHPDITEQGLDKYKAYLLEELTNQQGELIKIFASLYTKHFTQEEMEKLTAFYQTGIGQKAVKAELDMQEEIMTLTYEWGTKAVQRASERVHTESKEISRSRL